MITARQGKSAVKKWIIKLNLRLVIALITLLEVAVGTHHKKPGLFQCLKGGFQRGFLQQNNRRRASERFDSRRDVRCLCSGAWQAYELALPLNLDRLRV